MAINVLLVEDDELLVKRIQNHFINTEFSIDVDATGADALSMVKSRVNQRNAISLAIIDIVLPKRNGLQLAKELNTLTNIGVILLSSRDSQADRIAGLAQGADDYICKPVDLLELELRMRALYKRIANNQNDDDSEEFIEYADFKLHPDNRTLITASGIESRLTEAEHKVLICLIGNAGKATSREKISEEIGQPDWSPNDRTVDVLVGRLRKKLNDEKDQKRIVTVRGKGYMLSI
ncbi:MULTISPECIES: response regulator transcription factor [Pseudoalteromonas]|jgi:two-component system torCAD operon response regulator TorR|uniref:response regulator transcription factor n=1 Tax=Pseudoalteromonas TaxID=53246 RepID=UPI000C51CCC3|nr:MULTISPECIES: response regulator transcription factor [Pseudoalteromonas]MAY57511.1 DNA-binding response regulator [Pseudoalteromonas sp.]MDN3405749.1 response regulator transcription factor [Pseudoalteromonas sp. APC 3218]MDN3410212.1 response regulator transcription factor [Pseudoalteromonas sp. APC 3894]MDN3417405.1 response regulator transcription factor [Pseudoalteromonas sp. APC 3227]MDN3421006.1 response regulator transcription factor [Pseudoalteromonas sp. APC 3895]|tara:strand:- start:48 stop:752 length:705 start_codon:yes stop_codon:yes gene_type:complete